MKFSSLYFITFIVPLKFKIIEQSWRVSSSCPVYPQDSYFIILCSSGFKFRLLICFLFSSILLKIRDCHHLLVYFFARLHPEIFLIPVHLKISLNFLMIIVDGLFIYLKERFKFYLNLFLSILEILTVRFSEVLNNVIIIRSLYILLF